MVALVTGASSGIGKDIAIELAKRNYDVILVARDEAKLNELKKNIEKTYSVKAYIKICDLSVANNCVSLHDEIYKEFGCINILVNNAGFGTCGYFTQTDLDKELKMIDTNISALHILMKLFLQDMVKINNGYILNVASIAGFMSGPLMATYYATKNYVVSLSKAINKELQKDNSKVTVSVLCPGPVNTNFNNVANVKFSLKGLSSQYVAKYAIDKVLKGKKVIIPGKIMKLVYCGNKISPSFLQLEIAYHSQKRKM